MQITPEAMAQPHTSRHRLAERVVSPARWAATGRIGLRPHPGGLTTPAFSPSPQRPLTGLKVGRSFLSG